MDALCLVLRLRLDGLVCDNGDNVSEEIILLGSDCGDSIDPLGDVICSGAWLLFEDSVEHCPSGDTRFGSQEMSMFVLASSLLGLCELTVNVTVVVTVKLFWFCGVVGLDHLGGGGGGVFETVSFFSELILNDSVFMSLLIGSLFTGSFLFRRFSVFGRTGFAASLKPVGVAGSAVLNVLVRGFKFNTRSASGLDATDGGGL